MNRLALFALLLLMPASLFAQDRIAKLTYSIIDTSSNQTTQVKAIYTWLTHNIAYDVKQYQKGNRKHFTPEQLLRRKKALCGGYAELFSEMCRRIGVESYIINGYSKGFGYLKGEDFLKADHAWNVCHADSSWLIVDATWGSGGMDYGYTSWAKLLIALTGREVIRTKLMFVSHPVDDYFGILPEKAIETHFPLDSKWQLMAAATPYGTFVFDSILAPIPIDFVDKTYKTRVKSVSYNCFSDGVNSIRYNPNNHFDIGYQYYRRATDILVGLKSKKDSLMPSLLDTMVSYNEQSLSYIKDFRTQRRDTYSAKRLNQSSIYRAASRSVRGLGRIATTPNGRFAREEKRYSRLERLYEKSTQLTQSSIKTYSAGVNFHFDPPTKRDTSTFADLRKKIADNFTAYTFHRSILENKLPALAAILSSDTLSNEHILPYLDSVTTRMLTIRLTVGAMDEFAFFCHCDTLSKIYSRYDTTLAAKAEVRANFAKTFGEFNLSFTIAETALGKILRSYERMAKKCGDNETYSALATAVSKKLKEINGYKLQAVGMMVRNNQSWHQLADKQDNELAVFGRDGVTAISNGIDQFYGHISARNMQMYRNDIVIADIIKNSARNNLSIAKQLLKILKKEQLAAKKRH